MNEIVNWLQSNLIFLFLLTYFLFLFYIYVIKGDEIFEFNADKGYMYTVAKGNGTKEIIYEEKDKRDILGLNKKNTSAPKLWKIERFYHRLLGISVGLVSLLALFDRLGATSGKVTLQHINWPDFLLLLIAFIGLNGRLPTVAHAIQEWLRR